MNKLTCCLCSLCVLIGGPAASQEPPASKTLAATLEVYAFPKEGQSAEQQSKDEAACYDWAVSNTGSDPFELQKAGEEEEQQEAEQVEAARRSTEGAGARGAVRGAAAGAIVGEIADDDAGKGAAYGAAAGAVGARRSARRDRADAEREIQQESASQQESTAKQVEDFKKAFSACLEAKEYLVKY